MPPLALALLLLAAVMHATWNLLVKRAREKQVFTWWALVIGVACFLPFVAEAAGPIPAHVWPLVVASAIAETAYFLTLTRAYHVADFSLVYPMARGAAPVFLLLWTVLLYGDRPGPGGLAGLALLVAGLVLLGSAAWLVRRRHAPVPASSASGFLLALGVALCISVYTVIDGTTVRAAPAAAYTVAVMGCVAVLLGPPLFVIFGRSALVTELKVNWSRIAVVGLLNVASYVLVLRAYQMSRVSYAGAIREVSVVFGALLGWRLLGEGFGAPRLAGATLIFAGILVIALAG